MNEIKEYTNKMFEDIKHIDEFGNEYWLARELMSVLGYTLGQMVNIGSNTTRKISDYKLSRYACYLIVLNCDPRKKVIALAKTYFAIQTRKQELSEDSFSGRLHRGRYGERAPGYGIPDAESSVRIINFNS